MGAITCCQCKINPDNFDQVIIDNQPEQNIEQYTHGETKTGTGLNFF